MKFEVSLSDYLVKNLEPLYYTGYPKDLGPSRVIDFTSERQFVQLLHEGHPVVVAFTIRCTYTKHLDKVLEEAAAEFYPHIKFVLSVPSIQDSAYQGKEKNIPSSKYFIVQNKQATKEKLQILT